MDEDDRQVSWFVAVFLTLVVIGLGAQNVGRVLDDIWLNTSGAVIILLAIGWGMSVWWAED